MNFSEHQLREIAYRIWESEGKPNGQEARHWEMACKLTDSAFDVTHSHVSSDVLKSTKKKSTLKATQHSPIVGQEKPKKPRKKTTIIDSDEKATAILPSVQHKGREHSSHHHLK